MSRRNEVDWGRQSDPMHNPKFRRPWDEPLRYEERQADDILAKIKSARIFINEGRTDRATECLNDAERLVRKHRDRRHERLRIEVGFDAPAT